jgi:hypothetical protein
MWPTEEEETEVEPFRVTPGFIAFVTAIFLPVILAVVLIGAATLVAGEVHAAEEQERLFGDSPVMGEEVAGWKRTVVGICPFH